MAPPAVPSRWRGSQCFRHTEGPLPLTDAATIGYKREVIAVTFQKASPWLTIAQTAKRLGISEGQLRERIRLGDFPVAVIEIDGRWRVHAGELDRWLRLKAIANDH